MEEQELNVNDILNEMRAVIGDQAQQIAVLKATIIAIQAEKAKVE